MMSDLQYSHASGHKDRRVNNTGTHSFHPQEFDTHARSAGRGRAHHDQAFRCLYFIREFWLTPQADPV